MNGMKWRNEKMITVAVPGTLGARCQPSPLNSLKGSLNCGDLHCGDGHHFSRETDHQTDDDENNKNNDNNGNVNDFNDDNKN